MEEYLDVKQLQYDDLAQKLKRKMFRGGMKVSKLQSTTVIKSMKLIQKQMILEKVLVCSSLLFYDFKIHFVFLIQ